MSRRRLLAGGCAGVAGAALAVWALAADESPVVSVNTSINKFYHFRGRMVCAGVRYVAMSEGSDLILGKVYVKSRQLILIICGTYRLFFDFHNTNTLASYVEIRASYVMSLNINLFKLHYVVYI